MVGILIENGANVNAPSRNKDNFFNTPLMIAAWHGNYDVANLLIRNGACLNQQDQKNGFTALTKAVFSKSADIVELLLESGADRSILSFECMTALNYAEKMNSNGSHDYIISMLKEY